jgi:hypothetical protein
MDATIYRNGHSIETMTAAQAEVLATVWGKVTGFQTVWARREDGAIFAKVDGVLGWHFPA